MGCKTFYKRHENKIMASVLIAALLLFIGVRYDYYYDLNDDVLMKDILAGVYTGVPEGHNIQMMYPLSFFLSLLYRLFPHAPVYGIFLCMCQYGSLWILVERSLRFRTTTVSKAAMSLVLGLVGVTLLVSHLVFVQYTFTCAMLTMAAAYLFITSGEAGVKEFILKNLPAVFLCLLAYMLRSEMFALLLPMVCVAGVYRWSAEKEVWTRDNFKKYLSIIGGILLGMAVVTMIHCAAFGSADWKKYTAYFDSRTQLYDFQGIPSYEGNEKLYKELELTESEQYMLLEQYNFGLDDTLDAGQLDEIVRYQAEHKAGEETFLPLLAKNGRQYLYRLFHREPAGSGTTDDYPWNIMVIFGYITVLIMLLWTHGDGQRESIRKIRAGVGMLAFLFCVRTALWMFILMRGRAPERITHSLYMMEFAMLLAMLHVEGTMLRAKIANLVRATIIYPFVFAVTALASIAASVRAADDSYECREQANGVYREMKAYCREHSDCFYFWDVYSAVSYPEEPYAATPYSEKLFAEVDNTLGNYDLMGGWQVKSPSYEEKLAAFGIETMRSGLLEKDNVYFMAELAKGTTYFEEYFMEQEMDVQIEQTDTICDIIGVYQVKLQQ